MYPPEAEEYPAYISECSQGKEGGCWGSCNRGFVQLPSSERLPASLGHLWMSWSSWILESCSPAFCIKAFLYLLRFLLYDWRCGGGLFGYFGIGLSSSIAKHSYLHVYSLLPYLFDVSSLYCNAFHVNYALVWMLIRGVYVSRCLPVVIS